MKARGEMLGKVVELESSLSQKRRIEDLLSFKINFDVQHELECQILFDNRKDKAEEASLLDEYDDNVDTVSWESIEMAAWDLMKTKGMNWKLFSIWLESLIYIYGWDEILYCLTTFKAVLSSKIEILIGQEDRVGCIEFTDKAFSRAMCLQPIKDEDCLFEYLNYKNTNPQKLFDALSTFERKAYDEFMAIYKKSYEILASLPLLTKEVHVHFSKTLGMLKNLQDILVLYEHNFIPDEEEDEEEVADLVSKVEKERSKNTKEEAFENIAEALIALQDVDKHNLAIPLLRKIMRWQEKNISEILHEINDKEGAYYILSFLMD